MSTKSSAKAPAKPTAKQPVAKQAGAKPTAAKKSAAKSPAKKKAATTSKPKVSQAKPAPASARQAKGTKPKDARATVVAAAVEAALDAPEDRPESIEAKAKRIAKASEAAPAVALPDAAKVLEEVAGEDAEHLNERVRGLIRLAKEKGYLTPADVNDSLPDTVNKPDEIENLIGILENLEIDILDATEVETYKQRQEADEEAQTKASSADILDDPVRMYLRQMGQVPLLTREQEVAISKRIEKAEQKAQEVLFSVALTLPFQIDLAKKLIEREERFDRVVLDKKVESRENYFTNLPKWIEQAESLESKLDRARFWLGESGSCF